MLEFSVNPDILDSLPKEDVIRSSAVYEAALRKFNEDLSALIMDGLMLNESSATLQAVITQRLEDIQ